MSNEHEKGNFFRKFFNNKDYFITSFSGEALEDRVLELKEDLNQCLDMGDINRVDSILVELDHLYI